MEFGNTIPLFYLSMCFLCLTPLIGVVVLILVRKDRQLSKNILITILSTSLIVFLSNYAISVIGLIGYSGCCIDIGEQINIWEMFWQNSPEMLSSSLWFSFLGLNVGFVISFLLVIPITLLVRHFKHRNLSGNTGDSSLAEISIQEPGENK